MKLIFLSFLVASLWGAASAHNENLQLDMAGALLSDRPLSPLGSPTALTCDSCEEIVSIINSTLTQNATMQFLEDLVLAECAKSNNSQTCDTIVKDIFGLVPKIYAELHLLWPYPAQGICSILGYCAVPCCLTPTAPEQVHLALTDSPNQMSVTWTTSQSLMPSWVEWGVASGVYTWRANVSAPRTYTNGGWQGWLYDAIMTGLEPSVEYFYRVGSASSMSAEFSFVAPAIWAANFDSPLNFAVVGDMGTTPNGLGTISWLNKQLNKGSYDYLLHVGDISYANGWQKKWDDFLRAVEPIASRIPYMVCPGNHELFFNFTSYKERFVMPSSSLYSSLFYSWNAGPIHFIAYDAESVINTPYLDQEQLNWLAADLAAANTPSARAVRPWIIVYGHRPLYCSNNDADCSFWASAYMRPTLEKMFHENKVDLILNAHMHNYERIHPVFANSLVTAGTSVPIGVSGINTTYTSPQAPVYVVNGAAGNQEGIDVSFMNPPSSWSASRLSVYGFALMTVQKNRLDWQFFDDSDVLLDAFTIFKN